MGDDDSEGRQRPVGGAVMMVTRGSTANFTVSYDNALTNGIALSDAVLAHCEADLASLSSLFGGLMPAAASLPIKVDLVPGGGGASHPSCLDTHITCYISPGSDVLGVPAVVVAEVAEVLMATQARGWECGRSNGEGLSRVLATVLYPNIRDRFSVGSEWLNSSRPDWVGTTEMTDGDAVSTGCATLFLNYLAYQLNSSWPDVVAAAAPTLAATAANLGVLGVPFNDFELLLNHHFPRGRTAHLVDDDPFPLAASDMPFQIGFSVDLPVGTEGDNRSFTVPTYKRLIIEYASGVGFLPAGQNCDLAISTSLAGAGGTTQHHLMVTPGTFGVSAHPHAGHLVKLYADPGSTVAIRVDRDGPSGTATVRLALSGRLVDP